MLEKKNDYNIDNLAFDDECTVEENKENSNLDALDEDILVQVGEDVNTHIGSKVIEKNQHHEMY